MFYAKNMTVIKTKNPTIKMLKDSQIIEYDAKPTIENLTKFVESTL